MISQFFFLAQVMIKTKAFEKGEKKQVPVSELLDQMETKLPFHKK